MYPGPRALFPVMRLELAERLVCPAPHDRTPLIVVAEATADRDLLRGTAGCMRCYREARIVQGSLEFAMPTSAADANASAEGAVDAGADAADVEALLERLVVLLGISEPGMSVLLSAHYASAAPLLAARHDALVAVLDAAGASTLGVGHVRGAGDVVPFSDGTFAGAALGADVSQAQLHDAQRVVRVGGRLLAAVALPLPLGVRELARDATVWVGEVEASASPVMPLRRR